VDAGGPALNAARTVRALGGRARLLTPLGDGAVAQLIRAFLDGIDVHDIAPAGYAPPVSTVFVAPDAGRALASVNTSDELPVAPATAVAGAQALLLDGYVDAVALAENARSVGIPVVLDGGSFKPITPRLLPHVTVAALSADFRAPDGTDPLQWCQRQGAQAAVVTRGPSPVLVRTADNSYEVPVPEVDAVDTLGAGDVFHGALALALSSGATLRDAVAGAAVVASESVRHRGALTWAVS